MKAFFGLWVQKTNNLLVEIMPTFVRMHHQSEMSHQGQSMDTPPNRPNGPGSHNFSKKVPKYFRPLNRQNVSENELPNCNTFWAYENFGMEKNF